MDFTNYDIPTKLILEPELGGAVSEPLTTPIGERRFKREHGVALLCIYGRRWIVTQSASPLKRKEHPGKLHASWRKFWGDIQNYVSSFYDGKTYINLIDADLASDHLSLSLESFRDRFVKTTNCSVIRGAKLMVVRKKLDDEVLDEVKAGEKFVRVTAAEMVVEKNPGPGCWNCGGSHLIKDCAVPKNDSKIKEAQRKSREEFRNKKKSQQSTGKKWTKKVSKNAAVNQASINDIQVALGANDALKDIISDLKNGGDGSGSAHDGGDHGGGGGSGGGGGGGGGPSGPGDDKPGKEKHTLPDAGAQVGSWSFSWNKQKSGGIACVGGFLFRTLKGVGSCLAAVGILDAATFYYGFTRTMKLLDFSRGGERFDTFGRLVKYGCAFGASAVATGLFLRLIKRKRIDTCVIKEDVTSPLDYDGRSDSHRHGDILHTNPRMSIATVTRYYKHTPWYSFGIPLFKKKVKNFEISSEALTQFCSSEKALLHSPDEENLERIVRAMRNISTVNYDRRLITRNEDVLQNTARIAFFWTKSRKMHNKMLYD